nr:hypothetical protein [Mycobacterium avium]
MRTWRPERDRRGGVVLDNGRTAAGAGRVGPPPPPTPPRARPGLVAG